MPYKINSPGQFWVVRKPDEQGTVVAKFETTATDTSSSQYEIPDSCTAISVADRSALQDTQTDPSVLDENERETLGIY